MSHYATLCTLCHASLVRPIESFSFPLYESTPVFVGFSNLFVCKVSIHSLLGQYCGWWLCLYVYVLDYNKRQFLCCPCAGFSYHGDERKFTYFRLILISRPMKHRLFEYGGSQRCDLQFLQNFFVGQPFLSWFIITMLRHFDIRQDRCSSDWLVVGLRDGDTRKYTGSSILTELLPSGRLLFILLVRLISTCWIKWCVTYSLKICQYVLRYICFKS